MSILEITVDELATRLAGGGTQIFDVRRPDEYTSGHVPGAVLVPLDEVADRLDEFPRVGDLVVICRSGARSLKACEILAEHGIAATNIAGGTLAWIDRGGDVVLGDHPT
jgi:rhodanese-related sulfurtransferase